MTPLRKTVNVPLTPRQAFDLFADGIDGWWPRDRPGRDGRWRLVRKVKLTPGRGGRLTELLSDGETLHLGTVTRWEPGRSMTIRWEEPETQGEVTIAFTRTDRGTQVEVTHADLPIFTSILTGPIWGTRMSSFANKAALLVPV